MFIRKSKHDSIVKELEHEIAKHQEKANEYFSAWERMNELCSKAIREAQKLLLQNEYLFSELRLADIKRSTFTQDEIRTLITLCHPDKHNNSDRSNVITQKLLELRK